MAEVKIQSIIEKLDYEMKRALEDAVTRVLPGVTIDRSQLYREFRRSVGRKSSTWVRVNDDHVRKDCEHCGKET